MQKVKNQTKSSIIKKSTINQIIDKFNSKNMKKLIYTATIVALSATLLTACGKKDTGTTKPTSVYISGKIDGKAVYWKDGVVTELNGSTSNTTVTSLFVTDKGDVYVSGDDKSASGKSVAKYWQNGPDNPTILSGASANAIATSVYVSGTDVYTAGSDVGKIVYWKNKEKQEIGTGNAAAAPIFIVVK
jgi:hypothetical protein